MKKPNSFFGIGLGLISLSALLHYAHYLIFQDLHHTLIYLTADIAFIPLEVFFVTMVLDKILENREKKHLLEKLNMLVGLFYNEIGLGIFATLVNADKEIKSISENCILTVKSDKNEFKKIENQIKEHNHRINIADINLIKLRNDIYEHRELLVNLISNPSLLEHEEFSELLMAVFHLKEELFMKNIYEDQSKMKQADLDHLKVDIERAYRHLSGEWVSYMKHLKEKYPFLYITAIIKNPYDFRSEEEIEKQMTNNK